MLNRIQSLIERQLARALMSEQLIHAWFDDHPG